ncbi:unnamed protein product, partial [Linum tenue]
AIITHPSQKPHFRFSSLETSALLLVFSARASPSDEQARCFHTTMEESGGFSGPAGTHTPSGAGTIKRIRLENFMCHSNLQIELGPRVNFITGQNGSGKSAILTAICVAFGSRAKGTQRASTLKDFIKTGCSHATVEVVIKNEGHDAFKHDIYGNSIILERRINQTAGSMTLKDHRGLCSFTIFNYIR